MMWGVKYKTDQDKSVVEIFYTIEALFDWLQEFRNKTGSYPKALLVFKAECVFDGS